MGRVVVHVHGSSKNVAFRTAIIDYSNRLTTYGVNLIEHSDKTSAAEYLKQIDRQAGDSQIILLMETGQEMDSITFSEIYSSCRISRSDTHMVIGPSDGFGEQGQAYQGLSLSRMTMQHELAVVVLLEQLYRAASIHDGKPYHRV